MLQYFRLDIAIYFPYPLFTICEKIFFSSFFEKNFFYIISSYFESSNSVSVGLGLCFYKNLIQVLQWMRSGSRQDQESALSHSEKHDEDADNCQKKYCLSSPGG